MSAQFSVALAIDLGSVTGWAMRMGGGKIVHGFVSFKPQRFEGGGMRFLRFRRWLDELLVHGVDEIYFEEVRRHQGVDAAHVYGGLLSQLTAWCEEHQIPYAGVPVGVIKKHATGNGNASKGQVIAAIRAQGFESVTDDNEADAIAILQFVLGRYEPAPPTKEFSVNGKSDTHLITTGENRYA